MSKTNLTIIVIGVLLALGTCFSVTPLRAQESLAPLRENPVLREMGQERAQVRMAPLALPFFDDFYPAGIYPDQALWLDDFVYVNASFGVDPPTIGVATFDGLDALGRPYSILSEDHGPADRLTSQPIDLAGYDATDNIYLSFYYQPGGLGEPPTFDSSDVMNQDVLMVEFLDTAGIWDTAWVMPGDTLSPFRQVFLKVEEGRHLHGEFQFRFQSVGRLTGAFDHWQVDYVRLNRNRDPLLEQDIAEMAYQYLPSPLTSPYYAMPYNQFDSTWLADTHSVVIRNNFVQATTDIIDFYTARHLSSGTLLADYAGASRDLGPELSVRENYAAFPVPFDLDEDTVTVRTTYRFLVSAEDTSNAVSNRNNTVVKDQVFSNFYSYDDAGAERAYILDARRNDAVYGRAALRFEASVADTLRAVRIHFVNFNEDIDDVPFSLLVWRSLETDSTEEELLYRQDFIRPGELLSGDSLPSINGFLYIPLKPEYALTEDSTVVVEGEFFVGYEVGRNVMLPIGYDLNQDASAFHLVNFGQFWFYTQFSGALMINPVLGPPLPDRYVLPVRENAQALPLTVYPNPVGDYLRFETPAEKMHVVITDVLGRAFLERISARRDYVDVRSLAPGAYWLVVTDLESGQRAARQFIKP